MEKPRWSFTGRRLTQANIFTFNRTYPLHQKLGVIRTLMDRAHSIITEDEDMKAEEEHIQSSLKLCGFPNWSFQENLTERKGKPTV